ncbi:MAG: amine dehydrogenase large subunit [Syntrophomonadaceae bacterium]|nr:amine dehydrogenase large subunit [Syntrophomonadaceae bacterium]
MGTAYVINSDSHSISVINTCNRKVKGVIDLPYSPFALAPPTRFNQLWVLMERRTVGVVNLISHKITAAVQLPHDASSIALTPDAWRAYAPSSRYDSAYLSVIRTLTKFVKTKSLDLAYPLDVKVSPDGKWVYVLSNNPAYIIVINRKTLKVVDYIDTGGYSNQMAITANGKRAYVTNSEEAKYVSVVDLVKRKMIADIQLKAEYPYYITITPDQKNAYITHGPTNALSVINLAKNTLVKTIKCPGTPMGLAATPDNRYVYIAQSSLNRVAVLKRSTGKFVKPISVGTNPVGVVITRKALP